MSSAARKPKPRATVPDPQQSACDAGLRYVYDNKPGITRHRSGKSFRYSGPDGKPLRDADTLARIKSIVIPPAWTDVWISPASNGHLQATGRDARGRKQSRYHPRWRTTRDESKYEHMLHFAKALPGIRRRVAHDLTLPGLPREKVLATLIRLMETTHIRVGNETYARENKSYGLTTLRRRHVSIRGAKIVFNFKGKSGVEHKIDVTDRRLASIVQACYEIPGYELFDYLDEEGNAHSVGSSDVNAYLNEITGEHFTAKDFRTWAGSVLASNLLLQCEACNEAATLKKNVVEVIKSVATQLGNTPSVCRKCYVHPAVLDLYLGGSFATSAQRRTPPRTRGLHAEETALLHLLKSHAA